MLLKSKVFFIRGLASKSQKRTRARWCHYSPSSEPIFCSLLASHILSCSGNSNTLRSRLSRRHLHHPPPRKPPPFDCALLFNFVGSAARAPLDLARGRLHQPRRASASGLAASTKKGRTTARSSPQSLPLSSPWLLAPKLKITSATTERH